MSQRSLLSVQTRQAGWIVTNILKPVCNSFVGVQFGCSDSDPLFYHFSNAWVELCNTILEGRARPGVMKSLEVGEQEVLVCGVTVCNPFPHCLPLTPAAPENRVQMVEGSYETQGAVTWNGSGNFNNVK